VNQTAWHSAQRTAWHLGVVVELAEEKAVLHLPNIFLVHFGKECPARSAGARCQEALTEWKTGKHVKVSVKGLRTSTLSMFITRFFVANICKASKNCISINFYLL